MGRGRGRGAGKGAGCCAGEGPPKFATFAGDDDTDGEGDGKLTKRGWPDRVRIERQGRCKGFVSDLPMCLVFIIYWILMAVSLAIGLDKGDIRRLTHGTDYLQHLCGEGDPPPGWDPFITDNCGGGGCPYQSRDWSNNSVLWFPMPYTGQLENQLWNSGNSSGSDTLLTDAVAPVLNGSGLPTTMPTTSYDDFVSQLSSFSPAEALGQGICVNRCPEVTWSLGTENLVEKFSSQSAQQIFFSGFSSVYTYGSTDSRSPNAPFFYVWYNSDEQYHRCLPADSAIDILNAAVEKIPTDYATGYVNRWMNDCYSAWQIFIVGGVLALVLCALYTILLRCCLKPIILLCIIATFWLFLLGAYLCYTRYDELWKDDIKDNDDEAKAWAAGAVVSVILALTFAIVVCCLRKQILIACEIIIESGRVIRSDPTMLCIPIFTACTVGLLLLLVVFACLYIYTIEEDEAGIVTAEDATSRADAVAQQAGATQAGYNTSSYVSSYNTSQWTEAIQKEHLLWAWFFAWLWGMGLLNGIGFFVVASCTVQWYYSYRRDDDKKLHIGLSWLRGYCWAFQMIGGLVTGAFLVALVQFVRFWVKQFTEKMEKAFGEKQAKCIMCIVDCCLAYLERMLKYITKNSYIIMAVQGSGFWCSCCDLMTILMDNIGLMTATAMMSEIVFGIGKLLIVGGNCLIAYILLDTDLGGGVQSGIVIIIITGLFTFIIACLFMHVYSTVIDTMLILVARELRMGEAADTIACPGAIFKIATGKEKDDEQGLKDFRGDNAAKLKDREAQLATRRAGKVAPAPGSSHQVADGNRGSLAAGPPG